MDSATFDAIVRSVAGAHSRRWLAPRLVGIAVASAAGFALDNAAARRRKRKRKKRKNRGGSNDDPGTCEQTPCNGACVDLSSDNENCGACGNACAAGLTCCDGVCRALQSDNSNCGACGNACFIPGSRFCTCGVCVFCPLGATVAPGECTCECPDGQVDCEGVCRDTC